MQMEREGVHRVRKKLKSGVYRYHYYVFRGGPSFWTCDEYPVNDENPPRAFVRAYEKAAEEHKASLAAPKDTVDALVDRFKDSAKFLSLDPETQSFYAESFPDIRKEFGPDESEIFRDRKTRKDIKAWRDQWRDKPRTADKRVGALVKILTFAVDEGDLDIHVAGNIDKLYRSDRAKIIWDDDELGKLLSACRSKQQRANNHVATYRDSAERRHTISRILSRI